MSESETNTDDSQQSDSAIMLQLTAYLDGELEGREFQLVEERLATDQKYRTLMQELQQTWDVLDILPSSSASSDFTQSTMKLVVEDARMLTSQQKKSIWTWPFRFLALLLVPVIAGVITFLMIRYVQELPNRQLRRDFVVIKDYDVLICDRNLSIEFLEALADNPGVLGSRLPLPDDERYDEYSNDKVKLATLASERDVVKERVRTNREDYFSLDPITRKKVSELNSAVNQSDRREALRKSLYQYYKWLDGIGETDWSTVMDSPTAEEKVSTVQEIVDERYLRDFASLLPKEDLNSIYLALIDLLARRKQAIEGLFLQLFGWEDEEEIQILAKPYSGLDKSLFLGGARLKKIYSVHPERIEQVIYEEDLERITNFLLSENGKFFFKNADIHSASVKSEAHLLASWMVTAYDEKFSPEKDELLEFFRTLPSDVQDSLNNEFPADRARLLRKMWEESFQ